MEAWFEPHMRAQCRRMLQRRPALTLEWDAESLSLHVGAYKAVWRLDRGRWHGECSCNEEPRRCIHLFIAAYVFSTVCRNNPDWDHPSDHGASALDRHSSPDAANNDARTRLNSGTARDRKATEPVASPAPQNRFLEPELDFNHVPGQVGLRVYLREHDERRLIRMQRLFNLAREAESERGSRQWNHADRRFLKWITPQLRKNPAFRQNLYVMTVTRKRYEQWLEQWADMPDRFIDRQTQLAVAKQGATPLHFELETDNEWVRIHAVREMSDGRRLCFHQLVERLEKGEKNDVFDGHLLSRDPPVSRKLLLDVFGERSPRMRREHLCAYLGPLLEGRLDLLKGDNIRFESTTETIRLAARREDNHVVIKPQIGDVPLFRDRRCFAASLRDDGTGFTVIYYEATGLENVMDMLKNIGGDQDDKGEIRLEGTAAKLAGLAERWQSLPEQVHGEVEEGLRLLLLESPAPEALVAFKKQGAVIEPEVSWRVGHAEFTEQDMADAASGRQKVITAKDGSWVHADADAWTDAREKLQELGVQPGTRLFRSQAKDLVRSLEETETASVAHRSRNLADRLLDEVFPPAPPLPLSFANVLRDYQAAGYHFLADRWACRIGAVLADDMGLGKTLQALALITAVAEKRHDGNNGLDTETNSDAYWGTLVLCPASVLSVWEEHVKQYASHLKWTLYSGTTYSKACRRPV